MHLPGQAHPLARHDVANGGQGHAARARKVSRHRDRSRPLF
jgi:spermidine synthase